MVGSTKWELLDRISGFNLYVPLERIRALLDNRLLFKIQYFWIFLVLFFQLLLVP